jgi:hypothetical protein
MDKRASVAHTAAGMVIVQPVPVFTGLLWFFLCRFHCFTSENKIAFSLHSEIRLPKHNRTAPEAENASVATCAACPPEEAPGAGR